MRDLPEYYAGAISSLNQIKIEIKHTTYIKTSELNILIDKMINSKLAGMRESSRNVDDYLLCECGSGCYPDMYQSDCDDWKTIIDNPDNRKCWNCEKMIKRPTSNIF